MVPVAGKPYTTVFGDDLKKIAQRAYGDQSKWQLIYSANSKTLKTNTPEGIQPGEVIFIPEINERKITPNRRKINDINSLRIVTGSTTIPVYAARIKRTIKTAAGSWTGIFHRELLNVNKELRERIKPFSYEKAEVFIGNDLIMTTKIYSVNPVVKSDGSVINVEGFTPTVDMVDSNIPPPYQIEGVSLKKRAEDFLKPNGFKIEIDPEVINEVNEPQFRMSSSESQKQFDYLVAAAKRIGVLIGSTPEGNLLFTKAKTNTKPVCTISEGVDFGPSSQAGSLGIEFSATFDGRKRFNSYRVLSNHPSGAFYEISKDTIVPSTRFSTLRIPDAFPGTIKKAAEWTRSRQFADSLNMTIPVMGFRDPNGELWKENTLVTVVSDSLFVPDGYNFLISEVEYVWADAGFYTILSVTPPQSFTGEPIGDPWK